MSPFFFGLNILTHLPIGKTALTMQIMLWLSKDQFCLKSIASRAFHCIENHHYTLYGVVISVKFNAGLDKSLVPDKYSAMPF